ncbi:MULTISPECIES: aspartate aminotransferase family protein [Thermocrispum]|jgi:4-aminobutyrate aminotransferase|uniref:alanine--glyoxylate transaminase n=1 Tax=Thermocrispum agreste TaxID=37925 RepID=A0A2W4LEE3_9PSEU|nr:MULTISPECIES: aspartate aminotransferase family protein [Thermocrispum]PZM99409.1 MAG: aspartate aminotransferase family protein [Thermocrispum agreste]
MELIDRHRAVLPSWLALYYDEPIEIVHGNGRRVTDSTGRTYLDFFAGILTNALGYGVAEVNDAVRKQLDSGVLHTSTLYLIRSQVELAERIAELSGIPDAKVFFTNSGTEANETALLLATQYRRSDQVLAIRNSYHGRAFATVGVTGNRGWSASALSPVRVSYVHGGYRYRSPFAHLDDEEYIQACVDDLRDVLQTATSGDVACMIAEPIQGVGGFTVPPDGLYAAFKEVLDEYGILFISDEVQTGWGRTGEHYWGIQAHGVTPDLMTFAKGLGNGLAIGGVVGRAEIMDCLSANSISTFGGNPVATAGALAVLDYVESHDLQRNAAVQGARLLTGLQAIANDHDIIGEVRGKGLMVGIELVEPGGKVPSPTLATAVLEETRARGVLVGKGGLHGNVIRLAPPMTITTEEIDEGLAAIRDAVAAAQEVTR